MEKIEVKGKARLFKNPVLEALTRTSPEITFFAYVPLITAILIYGSVNYGFSPAVTVGVFILAAFLWTLTEYLMHRYVFHFIADNKVVERIHYMIHGVHHHYPKDEGRLFMPPVPGLILAVGFFSFFYLFIGSYTFVFFPGFVTGYLVYVFTHWAIHRFKKPKNLYGYVWDHHNIHHFKYPDKAFGVSSPLWDHIFMTMPPKKIKNL